MEINLGDLGISPAMLRKFQENYGKGIAAPKKAKKAVGKKKTVAKKTKPVGRRRGQPVAAKSPSTGRKGKNRSVSPVFQAGINLDGFRRLNPSAGINLDVKAPKPVAPKAPKPPTSGLKNLTDPSVRQRLKDLFGNADPIKTSQFPEYPTIENPEAGASRGRPYKGKPFGGSGGILPRANSGFVMDPEERARISGGGIGGIAKAQPVVPSSDALSGPGITGVEADKRAKAYAKANNIEMDGRTPIFTSEAQRDAMYAAGFRGTGRIVVPEEVQKARLAEARANETPEDRAFRESREAVLREREENPVPTGTLNPDQYRLLKNEDLMDDDDDFFEDTEGRFGQAGTVYSKDFSESIVDDVSAERAQLKRDAMAANLALGIDEPVGNVRDPNVGSINELFPDAPQAPTPPQLPEARETYIPSNILGPAFDPKDREAYAAKVQAQREQMQAGGNIQSGGYPTATNPFSAVPQTQFGGYGAQMPMQALNPYAGMARRNPAETDFFPTYIPRPAPVYEPLPDQGGNTGGGNTNYTPDAQPVKINVNENPGSSMMNYGSGPMYGRKGTNAYRQKMR